MLRGASLFRVCSGAYHHGMRSFVGGLASAIRNATPVPFVSGARGVFGHVIGRNTAETQMRAYGALGVLFQIVSRCANATAGVEWDLWKPGPSGTMDDREKVVRHAALDTWNKPNPFYTRQELVESVQQHVDLTGEGWPIFLNNAFGFPQEIWFVRPDRIEPVPDPEEFIVGYTYTAPDGARIPLERDQVAMLRMPNPLDPYRGMGPVQSLMVDIDAARYTAEWNRNFFLNSAEPGGVIQFETRLSDQEFKQFTSRWREQHQGVSQAHRVAILERGKWVDRKFSMRDMQFAELRHLSDETIRMAFGFPKPLLGSVDDVNRANAEAAEVVFGRWLVKPRCERWKQFLNNDFLPKFGLTARGLEFDYRDPVPADRQAKAAELTAQVNALTALLDRGIPADVACAMCGMPEMATMLPAGYGKTEGANPRELAEMIQKIYLGVDTVITWGEARELLNAAGADLNLALAPPEKPAAAAPFGAGQPAAMLRGERGERGAMVPAAEVATHLLAHHRDELRGEPGRDGAPGPAGERGERGPVPPVAEVSAHLLAHHRDELRGEPGDRGERGPAPAVPDVVTHLLAHHRDELRGEPGTPGDRGERGERGAAGPRGVAGAPGDTAAALLELREVLSWRPLRNAESDHAATAAAIQGDWQTALESLLDDWDSVSANQREQLATQVRAAVDRGDRPALGTMSVSTRDGEHALTVAMSALALLGAQGVADDASVQGIPGARPVEPPPEQLQATAVAVTALLASSLANAAGRRALQVLTPEATGDEVAADVTEHLTGLSDRYLRDNLGGALTAAQNAGRFATMQALEDQGFDARYVAVEYNDASLCALCAKIDGHQYDTVQDALQDYPSGGFKDCLGGPRCRGTVVPIWDAARARADRIPEVPKAARPYHNDMDGLGPLANTVKGSKAGTTNWTKLTGGQSSDTRLGVLADGRKVVNKRPPSWGDVADNKHQADAEQLVARMAHRLGIKTAAVYRDAVDRVYVEYIEGKVIAELGETVGARLTQEAYMTSLEGRRLGLLDVLTGQSDRNSGNMIIAEDGSLVGIDHGAGWLDHVLGNPPGPRGVGGISEAKPTWNYVREGKDGPHWIDNDLSQNDIAEIRRRLQAMRPDFELVGRGDWLDYSLGQLDQLAGHARGTDGSSILGV